MLWFAFCLHGVTANAQGLDTGLDAGPDWESPTVGLMRWIEPGVFTMGAPDGAIDADADEQQHQAVVERPFWMMQHEVTQAEWVAVMGDNPSLFSRCADCPVEGVSWYDAVAFAERLSEIEGVPYRLPTEIEWEWAARAGEPTEYAGSDDFTRVAWTRNTSGTPRRPHEVCTLDLNAFGLCDMSGNVWEWVTDWYASFPAQTVPATSVPSSRVVRGGSWFDGPKVARVSERGWVLAVDSNAFTGVRLVRD